MNVYLHFLFTGKFNQTWSGNQVCTCSRSNLFIPSMPYRTMHSINHIIINAKAAWSRARYFVIHSRVIIYYEGNRKPMWSHRCLRFMQLPRTQSQYKNTFVHIYFFSPLHRKKMQKWYFDKYVPFIKLSTGTANAHW